MDTDGAQTLMGCFEKKKDVDVAEKSVEVLTKLEKDLELLVLESLVWTYLERSSLAWDTVYRYKMWKLAIETAKLATETVDRLIG